MDLELLIHRMKVRTRVIRSRLGLYSQRHKTPESPRPGESVLVFKEEYPSTITIGGRVVHAYYSLDIGSGKWETQIEFEPTYVTGGERERLRELYTEDEVGHFHVELHDFLTIPESKDPNCYKITGRKT